MPEQQKYAALVTGATGVQGSALLPMLDKDDCWQEVWTISRRKLDKPYSGKVHSIVADLNDPDSVRSALKEHGAVGITHVFHLAFHGDMTNLDAGVAKWLVYVVEAVEKTSGNSLQHVFFEEGVKYYGLHWGPPKTPLDERDPRVIKPDYYYTMEDWVDQKVNEGATWTWSSLRPPSIIGVNVGSWMNLLSNIAVYATFCKEEGIAMRFPGTWKTWDSVWDVVDNKLLMDAAMWTSTHKEAANESFNINNGDVFRWRQLWPQLAAWFGLEAGDPLPMPLAKIMPLKKQQWEAIKKKHDLADTPYEQVCDWTFADAVWQLNGDAFANTVKLRQAGYTKMKLDTATAFYQRLEELADRRIIPRYGPKHRLNDMLGRQLEAEE